MKGISIKVIIAAKLMSLVAIAAWAQGIQNVELHGYMLNRFYANPDSSAEFVTERVSLSAVGQLGADGTAYVEVYFHPWLPSVTAAEQFRTYLESAYVDLPFAKGRIRIGKGRQLNFGLTPSYPNRKTTQYGILSETFTQDRIQGFQYAYKKGDFDFGASLYTDQSIGTRGIGDFPGAEAVKVVQHFVDKDTPSDISGELAGSVRLGITTPCLQAHISGAVGKFRQSDADTIAAPYGIAAGVNTDTDHNKYGVDVVYSNGPFVAQAEWYRGNFSFLGITGYSVLVGYQPKDSRRVYLRYAALNNNRTPIDNPPLVPPYVNSAGQRTFIERRTWDTQQLTLGIVQPIRKGVWAEFQYEKNMERPGSADNDLLFVEFFTGF